MLQEIRTATLKETPIEILRLLLNISSEDRDRAYILENYTGMQREYIRLIETEASHEYERILYYPSSLQVLAPAFLVL